MIERLNGKNIILQNLQEQDEQAYLKAFSQEVRSALRVSSIESERLYLQEQFLLQQQKKIYFYVIFDKKTEVLIGAVHVRSADFSPGQLYTWVHHDYWGMGAFQEAVLLASQDYFRHTGSLYLDATVDCDNIRSYKALKKAGFADIGINEGQFGKQFVIILRNRFS